jgi:hypothetical protein
MITADGRSVDLEDWAAELLGILDEDDWVQGWRSEDGTGPSIDALAAVVAEQFGPRPLSV